MYCTLYVYMSRTLYCSCLCVMHSVLNSTRTDRTEVDFSFHILYSVLACTCIGVHTYMYSTVHVQ